MLSSTCIPTESLIGDLPESLVEFKASSLSFFVCSCSILTEITLMRLMYSENCCRSRSGPRLKLHKIGSTSKARKSESAMLAICLNTPRAAIITEGSLVLITFSNGTIFSCIVYLSSIPGKLDLEFPFTSSRAPLAMLETPPQSKLNASKQRTLIVRLFVLLNTAATVGKSSFLIVEKSRTMSIVESVPRDLSTIV